MDTPPVTATGPRHRRQPRRAARFLPWLLAVAGIALIVAQVAQPRIADQHARSQQADDVTSLRDSWATSPAGTADTVTSAQTLQPAAPHAPNPSTAAPAPAVEPNETSSGSGPVDNTAALASSAFLLSVPDWGREWAVHGFRTPDDLNNGPTWFPTTTPAGVVGNTVVIGHRTGYGAPFYSVPSLTPGDTVVLETQQSVFRYTVTRRYVIREDNTRVLNPVPFTHREADTAVLTLLTCEIPTSSRRVAVEAELTGTTHKP